MAVTTLTTAFDRLHVEWSRTSSKTFTDVLSNVVVEPAVGSPLPFRDISLSDSAITINPAAAQLDNARTGVTAVELAVASYGSLVIHQDDSWIEGISLFPPLHVAILRRSDIVADMNAAFQWISERVGRNSTGTVLATGPSATADMGSLVHGAHGPEQVHVIILNDL